jgi:lantibiotic modifying enzyme
MLYQPENFEPLSETPWSEERARDGIRAIVADAEAAFDPDDLWPAHEWDLWASQAPLKDLYCGAAGVVFALDALRRRGLADVGIDLAGAARRALDLWQTSPDLSGEENLPTPREGLLTGETGLLIVAWRLAQSADLADRLHARVRENKENEANEVMWGAPGTMLAAHALHEWTGEQRWLDAWQESAEAVTAARDDDGLWTQNLHGSSWRDLGPVHGAAGNVVALGDDPHGKTRDAIERFAVVEDGLANWPPYDDGKLVRKDGVIRVQWCHGAPGIVTSLAEQLDEDLVIAGAELTWRAGPHGPEKGGGICHGTAGNGYTFLKTFERTGDEQWLDRARRFAMHALGQVTSRYSLFTGDLGIALYVADCIEARARYPIIDSLSD